MVFKSLALFSGLLAILLPGLLAQDQPTLLPASPFNPSADASKLRNAMSGVGTNEKDIVDVLCYRVASQRDTITRTYQTEIGRDLRADLRSELSGDFRSLTVKLTYSMYDYLANELRDAMFGPGTKETAVTEVLTSRPNSDISQISTSYQRLYGVTLSSSIQANFGGGQQTIFLNLAEGRRAENTVVDSALVTSDVKALYDAGEGLVGTNEAVFVSTFSLRSNSHLREVSNQYARTYSPSTLANAVRSEFSGTFRDSLLDILSFAEDKNDFFARKLKQTMAGAGTDEQGLSRQLVSRAETDLGNIKTTYQRLYTNSLASDVASDTSGSYETCVLAIIA